MRSEGDAKTSGGLIIPDTAKEKPQEGEVVAVGAGAKDEDGERIAMDVKAGDRILFGTDFGYDPEMYRVFFRFLETFDESFDYDLGDYPLQGRWQIHGIGLPDDVLEKVYAGNARRVLLRG